MKGVALAAATALVAGAIGCGGGTSGGTTQSANTRPSQRDAHLSIAYGPYLGVAECAANRLHCNVVGIEVLLKEPATRVSVSIAGIPVHVSSPAPIPHQRNAVGRDWGGFLHGAGLTDPSSPLYVHTNGGSDFWAGDPPVSVPVTITARFPNGPTITRTLRKVPLHAGFG